MVISYDAYIKRLVDTNDKTTVHSSRFSWLAYRQTLVLFKVYKQRTPKAYELVANEKCGAADRNNENGHVEHIKGHLVDVILLGYRHLSHIGGGVI